jgi:preprotein translocase subunit SecA
MTGTAWEARQELWDIYALPVVRIPTHNPCIRQAAPVCIVGSSVEKHDRIRTLIKDAIRQGRSVLIGTRSVKASQEISTYLARHQYQHNLLNAERHEDEAQIIKQAGQVSSVTVATNMAGRGTDIKLSPEVKKAGGLVVILTERHESRRIDRQLFGRCGRQGDPGTVFEVISLDDELITRQLGWLIPYLHRSFVPFFPITRTVCLSLFFLAQWFTERQARLTRYGLVERTEALEDALGFAGKEYQI